MGKVTTSIDIDAPPEDVWAAVTDLPASASG
ncbi:MAG: SRPBCC family protein [Thermoleophilaceae bacterium]